MAMRAAWPGVAAERASERRDIVAEAYVRVSMARGGPLALQGWGQGRNALRWALWQDARFFPEARLNVAENLLKRRGGDDAIVFRGEDKIGRRLTWDELHAEVSRLQQALEAAGVKPGDRVAGFVANMPEAVIAMLATASLGAIWSSCSPDFGIQGVVDRFGQIE